MIEKKIIFLFHRDYRTYDNLGLIHCFNLNPSKIYPVFIFTPEQANKTQNKYFSNNSLQFIIDSLMELNNELNNKLNIFYGDTQKILKSIVKKEKITDIIENEDYTPYAINRQNKNRKLCESLKINYEVIHDALLLPIGTINVEENKFYKIYTPFYKKALTLSNNIPKPTKLSTGFSNDNDNDNDNLISKCTLKTLSINNMINYLKIDVNPHIKQKGGRKNGLISLNKALKDVAKNYIKTRNNPCENTTFLSAHLHLGTLSIREVYYKFKEIKADELIKQLWWREFYAYCIIYSDYKPVKWLSNNKNNFKKWCNGETGCEIVDAGMKQLNKTGWMHNRLRMIVATYLIYYLHLPWEWGEQYFAQKLVDISLAQNRGNWIWVAGVASYSNPYFKALSPESQQKRFDPGKKYINYWIKSNDYKPIIIDYKEARKKGIKMIKDSL